MQPSIKCWQLLCGWRFASLVGLTLDVLSGQVGHGASEPGDLSFKTDDGSDRDAMLLRPSVTALIDPKRTVTDSVG